MIRFLRNPSPPWLVYIKNQYHIAVSEMEGPEISETAEKREVIFMHAPSLHNFHPIHWSFILIDHHAKMTIILLVIAFITVGLILSSQPDRIRTSPFSETADISMPAVETLRPLTYLDDPQYADEYVIREQTLTAHLAALRDRIQADRVYLALYRNVGSFSASKFAVSSERFLMEQEVFKTFEITKGGIAQEIKEFQDVSRDIWLQVVQDTSVASYFFSQPIRSYGFELYNGARIPIGYIGIEKTQQDEFREPEIHILRETARAIEITLLQPLEPVNRLKKL